MKATKGMSPNLYAILQAIKDEEAFRHSKNVSVLAGNARPDPNPSRTKKFEDKKRRLKAVVNQYGMIPVCDYMEALI